MAPLVCHQLLTHCLTRYDFFKDASIPLSYTHIHCFSFAHLHTMHRSALSSLLSLFRKHKGELNLPHDNVWVLWHQREVLSWHKIGRDSPALAAHRFSWAQEKVWSMMYFGNPARHRGKAQGSHSCSKWVEHFMEISLKLVWILTLTFSQTISILLHH